MRLLIAILGLMIIPLVSANAAVEVGINIGINVPEYPELVPVPGYPVYYDPSQDSNYFFYDGQYWVYADDNWYSSDWYNGPWQLVEPDYVPLFVLRVPVRYYRRPPAYFGEWRADDAPHWGEHWGNDWRMRHHNWNQWDHQHAPRPAPLPSYQRQYLGDRYPRGEDQHSIHDRNYHYQPHASGEHHNDSPPSRPTQTPERNSATTHVNEHPVEHAQSPRPHPFQPSQPSRPEPQRPHPAPPSQPLHPQTPHPQPPHPQPEPDQPHPPHPHPAPHEVKPPPKNPHDDDNH